MTGDRPAGGGDEPTLGLPTVQLPSSGQQLSSQQLSSQQVSSQPTPGLQAPDLQGFGGPGAPPPVPAAAPGEANRLAWVLVVLGVIAVIAAASALVVVVVNRGRDDTPAVAAPSQVSPATTPSSVSTTGSTTVVPPAPEPAPIAAPPTTVDPRSVATATDEAAVATATEAVDLYLAASGGRDESTFAALWSYPIEDRYGEKGQNEAQLRAAARAYWDRYPSMTFRRAGATTVSRSGAGWETSTPYSFDGVKANRARTCGTKVLHLGFTDGWLVRTASEDTLDGTC